MRSLFKEPPHPEVLAQRASKDVEAERRLGAARYSPKQKCARLSPAFEIVGPEGRSQFSFAFTSRTAASSRRSAVWPHHLSLEQAFGGGRRDFGSGGAHIGDRLRLGLGDLLLGHPGATGDHVFQLGLGFGGQTLGLKLGGGDDGLGLCLGLALAALIFGDQLLRFFAQAAGLFQLGADAIAAGNPASG